MIKHLTITDEMTAAQIWRLQHAAYAVEAGLVGFWNLPPLMDTIETIRNCGETFFGIQEEPDNPGSDVIAAIACEEEDGIVTICRMMVHPEHFRRGLATRLIRYVESLFPHARGFIVSTGTKNEPAIRLYESMGFAFKRQWMPLLGLSVTEFYKPGKGG